MYIDFPSLEQCENDQEREHLKDYILVLRYYNIIQDALISNLFNEDQEFILSKSLIESKDLLKELNRWNGKEGLEKHHQIIINSHIQGDKEASYLREQSELKLFFHQHLKDLWKALTPGLELMNQNIITIDKKIAREFWSENLEKAQMFRTNHRDILGNNKIIHIKELEALNDTWMKANKELDNLDLTELDFDDDKKTYLYTQAFNLKHDYFTSINNKLDNFQSSLEKSIKLYQTSIEGYENLSYSQQLNKELEQLKSGDKQELHYWVTNTAKEVSLFANEWMIAINKYRTFKTLTRVPNLIKHEDLIKINPDNLF